MHRLATPPAQPPAGVDKALEKAIAVQVPRPALLDVKPELTRHNPSFFVTAVFTVLTSLLLGLCFVIVGIPPLFIEDNTGQWIYVAVMVPMLSVLGTVLSYYATQHPQRMFNSALAQATKEMEQHASYLTIAVGNVEKELAARGVALGDAAASAEVAAGTAGLPEVMRNRSVSVTPVDSAVHRISSFFSPGLMNPAIPSAMPGVCGADLFHGIDKLEEDRDMVIATVHVGKEWRWLLGHLRDLKLRNLAGPSNPLMHHQRLAVQALAVSVARVEKLILTLYYSSFVLHRINALAPINPWGSPLTAAPGPAFCSHPGTNRGSAHVRAATSVYQPPAPPPGLIHLHSPHGLERCQSNTESIFTLPRETPREGAKAQNLNDDEVSGRGSRGSPGLDAGSASQLTSPETRGFALGRQVRLPQFPPLFGGMRSGSGGGGGDSSGTSAQRKENRAAAAAEAALTSPIERALHLDPNGSTTESLTKGKKKKKKKEEKNKEEKKKDKRSKSSAAGAGAVASNWHAGGAGNDGEDGANTLRSVEETEGNDVEDEVVDVSDVSGTHSTALRAVVSATALPSRSHMANITVQARTRTVGPSGGAAGTGAETTTTAAAGAVTTGDDDTVFSPRSATLAHQSSTSPNGRRDPMALPAVSDRHARGIDSKTKGDDNTSPTSSAAPPHHRQPGTALVPSATLILHRGARFMGDEADIFATILIHVRKGDVTQDSRLYGVLAHTSADPATGQPRFRSSGGDSVLTRSSVTHPFTIYHISDHEGEREGLTESEKKLLQFAHCRPEDQGGNSSDGGDRHHPTDLSSLAVRRSPQESNGSGASTGKGVASFGTAQAQTESSVSAMGETTGLPSSVPVRTTTSVFADHIDSFIVATHLLPDRPMRLAFLTVVLAMVRRRGDPGMSMTFSGTSMPSPPTPPLSHAMDNTRELHALSSRSVSPVSESSAPLPVTKTVPVLECVINGVLCVLTKMEITVGTSLANPSKVLLVGVSLEDVSQQVSERDALDGDEMPHPDTADSLVGSLSSQSLAGASAIHRLARTPGLTSGTRAKAVQGMMAAPETGSIVQRVNGDHCTLGQEFREVIRLR